MPNKMLLAVYNNILDEEIEKVLKNSKIDGFTVLENVKGKGKTSGYHLGTNVFPDLNNLLMVVGNESEIEVLKNRLKELKNKYSEEGIKIFVLPVEEII